MKILTAVDATELAELRRRDEFFWLDLHDPGREAVDVLGSELGLHPLALEDSHEWRQRPKVERYHDYVFLVFYTVASTTEGLKHRPLEVHIYVSGGFIVTMRRDRCAPMDLLHGTLDLSDETEDYLVYRILDELTDVYFPLISAIEERIDELEALVLDSPRHDQLATIYRFKQDIQGFERRVLAQHEYFPAAVEAIMGLPALSRGARLYLRDVADHLTHVADELHRHSTDLSALTDTFYNANTNKLNQSATRLSVVATFFLVATLITGFFGQNFGWLIGHIDTRSDFLLFGVCGLVGPLAILSFYFWRRRDDWM